MGKRKNHSSLAQEPTSTRILTIKPLLDDGPPSKRRASQRKISQPNRMPLSTNPNKNANILDSAEALRASPDADEQDERMGVERAGMDAISQIRHDEEALSLINGNDSESPLTDISDSESSMLDVEPKRRSGTSTSTKVKANTKSKEKQVLAKKSKVETEKTQFLNPEADEDEEADEEEIQAALSRPPPVNSDYLPLPWKGRLGYVREELLGL